MEEHESLIIHILKRFGIITRIEISKEDMCKQAQDVCNHNCEDCAWSMKGERMEAYKPVGTKSYYCKVCKRFIWVQPMTVTRCPICGSEVE